MKRTIFEFKRSDNVKNKGLIDYMFSLDGIFDDAVCEEIISVTENTGMLTPEVMHSTLPNQTAEIWFKQTLLQKDFPIELLSTIQRKLDIALHEYQRHIGHTYKFTYPFCYEADTFIRKCEPGGARPEHIDSCCVAASVVLNDNFDGGELEFFAGELCVRPAKGSVVMFPANFMYPHAVKRILSGTRYAIINHWLSPVCSKVMRTDGGYVCLPTTRNGNVIGSS